MTAAYAMSVNNLKSKRKPSSVSATKYPQMEFLELKQFEFKDHKIKFDLSGLAQHKNGKIYAISDKEKTPFIYEVDWKKAKLDPKIDFNIKDKLDIEAIDICGDDFYLSNEKNDKFYIVREGAETEKLKIDLSHLKSKGAIFSGNDGYEGMAIDCENQILYAVKEMLPRHILTIDLKTNKLLKKWSIPEVDTFDSTDAKYENGFLYILERSGMLIAKVDVKSEKVVQKYSYQSMEKGPGYLFGPAMNAMGEALMLTSDEIWIGFDNNGLKATEQAQKELGLKGRHPLIMRFKRPDNF